MTREQARCQTLLPISWKNTAHNPSLSATRAQGSLTDPKYTAVLRHVWLWEDFFAHEELGGTDTGIDLVAGTTGGEYWAIQCKYYSETATID
jgi:predicted helicase